MKLYQFNNVLSSAVTEFFTLKSFEIVHVRSIVSHSNKITIAALCGKLHYRPSTGIKRHRLHDLLACQYLVISYIAQCARNCVAPKIDLPELAIDLPVDRS
jgi:hypothetical protein